MDTAVAQRRLVCAFRVRRNAATFSHKSPDRKCSGSAVALGAATGGVSAQFCPYFRGRTHVRARALAARACADSWLAWLCDLKYQFGGSASGGVASLSYRPPDLLYLLSWRAISPTSTGEAAHHVLSGDRRGRRLRRYFCGLGRARYF